MAYAMTKRGSLDNCITYEFICDTAADMDAIEDKYRTIGTIAVVLEGNGGMEVYIAGSDKDWRVLSVVNSGAANGGSGSGGSTVTSGLSIHVCSASEVRLGKPNITSPSNKIIYLVPATNASTGNLYDEYIYVNSKWEKFGGVNLDNYISQEDLNSFSDYIDDNYASKNDLNNYATLNSLSNYMLQSTASNFALKNAPTFTSSISMGRIANTTIGADSIATGDDVIASGIAAHAEGHNINDTILINETNYQYGATGNYSHTEGNNTIAYGVGAHAEGDNNISIGDYAHAEGQNTIAIGNYSHTEGIGAITSKTINDTVYSGSGAYGIGSHSEGEKTWAIGDYAHAEGQNTMALNRGSHAEGETTTASGVYSHAEGSNTQATQNMAHAEGKSTIAAGEAAHAEGGYTIAKGQYSHVGGLYNIEDTRDTWPEWQPNTFYKKLDKVKRTTDNDVQYYVCSYNHNSSTVFNSSRWNLSTSSYKQFTGCLKYAEIIGNGTYESNRSNARALDWGGNEYLGGNLYINCKNDSTSGDQVLTYKDILIKKQINNYEEINLGELKVNSVVNTVSNLSLSKEQLELGFLILKINDTEYLVNGRIDQYENNLWEYQSYQISPNSRSTSNILIIKYISSNTYEIRISEESISDTKKSVSLLLPNYDIVTPTKNIYINTQLDGTGGVQVATINDIPPIKKYLSDTTTRALGTVNLNEKSQMLGEKSYFDFTGFQSGPAILTIGDIEYNITGVYTDGELKRQYESLEQNSDGNNLITITQMPYETSAYCIAYTMDPSLTPENNVSITFLNYKLASPINDLYIAANENGTGGEKLATEAYVDTKVPTPPTTDGTYTLQVTVTNGVPTYNWV